MQKHAEGAHQAVLLRKTELNSRNSWSRAGRSRPRQEAPPRQAGGTRRTAFAGVARTGRVAGFHVHFSHAGGRTPAAGCPAGNDRDAEGGVAVGGAARIYACEHNSPRGGSAVTWRCQAVGGVCTPRGAECTVRRNTNRKATLCTRPSGNLTQGARRSPFSQARCRASRHRRGGRGRFDKRDNRRLDARAAWGRARTAMNAAGTGCGRGQMSRMKRSDGPVP